MGDDTAPSGYRRRRHNTVFAYYITWSRVIIPAHQEFVAGQHCIIRDPPKNALVRIRLLPQVWYVMGRLSWVYWWRRLVAGVSFWCSHNQPMNVEHFGVQSSAVHLLSRGRHDLMPSSLRMAKRLSNYSCIDLVW